MADPYDFAQNINIKWLTPMTSPEQLPAAIVLSRLDNFDTKGDVRRILAAGSYKKTRTLQTFEIWEK